MQTRAAMSGSELKLPLAIMVSDDTAPRTEYLLKANDYFGLAPEQVTILKQEKVGCLIDNEARLALDPTDKFNLLTKPHGHGDVHFLLHSSGTLKKWQQAGTKWVYFMQDTNSLVMKVLPACLGVSKALSLQVNSVCVPRAPGEAIGCLMALLHKNGSKMTVNVEYNQIDALLKATVEERGDVCGEDGMSPWPGSINQLLFALEPYLTNLDATLGKMPEFVNPKYTDRSKTAFKAPTRLECLMQDYPKSMPKDARVGFCTVKGALTFSPVKNNLAEARKKSGAGEPTHSAASGEADYYAAACETLSACGVRLPQPSTVSRAGVEVVDMPRVVIDPSFGLTLSEWKAKLPSAEKVSLAPGSTLVLKGDLSGLCIESLTLQGALVISLCPGAKVTLKSLKASNRGWSFAPLREAEEASEALKIRGYTLHKDGQRELRFDKPGEFVVDDSSGCALL
uniref:UTP-monosaccharide-1-phosphate uridylyltransferase n=1 Tax=Coccolithus braarudii TaxID=221442 RepID=A0A7S0Q906_9EUKA